MHLIYSEGGAEVPALSGYYRNPAYFTRCEHDATLVYLAPGHDHIGDAYRALGVPVMLLDGTPLPEREPKAEQHPADDTGNDPLGINTLPEMPSQEAAEATPAEEAPPETMLAEETPQEADDAPRGKKGSK